MKISEKRIARIKEELAPTLAKFGCKLSAHHGYEDETVANFFVQKPAPPHVARNFSLGSKAEYKSAKKLVAAVKDYALPY